MAYLFQDLAKGKGSVTFKNSRDAQKWYSDVVKSLSTPESQRTAEQKEKIDWYENNVESMSNIDRDRFFNLKQNPFKIFDKDEIVSKIAGEDRPAIIGKMYLYKYDAYYKDVMPYYDMFPLVFPIEFYSNGFLGINLHYLPPVLRAGLMNALYDIANNSKFNSSRKLNISYAILKDAGNKFQGFKECVKRYRSDRLRSNFHYVNPVDWDKAVLLPLQQWHINPNSRYNPTGSPPW